jgi:hypothetical protein
LLPDEGALIQKGALDAEAAAEGAAVIEQHPSLVGDAPRDALAQSN